MATPLNPLPLDAWREAFEAFLELPAEGRADEDARRAAFERFAALGFPTRRLEGWRFTDLAPLRGTVFEPGAGDRPLDAAWLAPLVDGPRLVFVNGRHAPWLSQLEGLPAGARLEAVPALPVGFDGDDALAALHAAFVEDEARLVLAPGVALERPLHLLLLSVGDGTLATPRVVLELGEGAAATVVEEHRGQGAYWSNPQASIRLRAGARLTHVALQDEAPEASHTARLAVRLARDARLALARVWLGGRLARADLALALDGEGAEATLEGLSLVGDGQTADHHVDLRHAVAHGSSRQTFRAVLSGAARSVFDGTIRVEPGAQKTDAQQQARNLLLSRRAVANTQPRLEIFADDVKCGHGATVGALDDDALFYLRSRGLGEAEARAMLVRAFAAEFVDVLADAGLVGIVRRLEARLAAFLDREGRP